MIQRKTCVFPAVPLAIVVDQLPLCNPRHGSESADDSTLPQVIDGVIRRTGCEEQYATCKATYRVLAAQRGGEQCICGCLTRVRRAIRRYKKMENCLAFETERDFKACANVCFRHTTALGGRERSRCALVGMQSNQPSFCKFYLTGGCSRHQVMKDFQKCLSAQQKERGKSK